MLDNNFNISRSFFTKRQLHQTLDGQISTIFENDHRTIQSRPRRAVNTGNFKIIFNNEISSGKKYGIGGWVTTPNNDYFWTYNQLVDDVITEDDDIMVQSLPDEYKLKLDFSDLTSFAYFGSLMDYIKASIEEIVVNFPGSLWIRPVCTTGQIYELDNPFGIDVHTEKHDADDSLRTLASQLQNYEIVETNYVQYYLPPCGVVNYRYNSLGDCKYEINDSEFVQLHRHVYVNRVGNWEQPEGWDDITNWDEGNIPEFGSVFMLNNPSPYLANVKAYHPYIKLLNSVVMEGEAVDTSVCETGNIRIELNYIYNDEGDEPCTLLRIETRVYKNEVELTTDYNGPNAPQVSYNIKPKAQFVESFFNNLNDFQSLLLNRNSNPVYTTNFKIPVVTDTGTVYQSQLFTWTTPSGGWNIDLTSVEYINFINLLIEAAGYLDNIKTDNIYRMLTHESIKNMDWSFQRIKDEMLTQEHILGGSRMNKILRIYGIAYDELRKYIRGIENMNNLSYDQKNNYPDALLNVNLEYEGWQVLSLLDSENSKDKSPPLFYGERSGYTAKDLELEFYRRLLLNSPHITRWKGTKHGMEMLMGLFGIERDEWEIETFKYIIEGTTFPAHGLDRNNNELFQNYIKVEDGQIRAGFIYRVDGHSNANATIEYNDVSYFNGQSFIGVYEPTFSSFNGASVYLDELENIGRLNTMRSKTMSGSIFYEGELGDEEEPDFNNTTFHPDDLHDLTIERYFFGEFEDCPICDGVGATIVNGNTSVCPRCNGTGLVRDFDGIPVFKGNSDVLYYQQFGGWYQSTYRNLRMVNLIEELFRLNRNDLRVGELYWVNNITDTTIDVEKYTNYWVLIDPQLSSTMDGWLNVSKEDYDYSIEHKTSINIGGSEVWFNFYNLENTKDINKGNNPHHDDSYDMGISYLEHFAAAITRFGENEEGGLIIDGTPDEPNLNNGIFKYVIDRSPQCIREEWQFKNMLGIGFTIKEVVDSKKSWHVEGGEIQIESQHDSIYDELPIQEKRFITNDRLGCKWEWVDGLKTRKVDLESIDGVEWFKVINTKKLRLTFNPKSDVFRDGKVREFNDVILPYLEDMIPSTTIVELRII